jgi:hypothetical protein
MRDGLVANQRKELDDEPYTRMDEWMDGRRMWIWAPICVLVVVLLVVAINKQSNK